VRRTALVLFFALGALLQPGVAAAQDDSAASRFIVLANQERRSRGIRELSMDAALTGTACDWNKQISSTRLDHDPQLREHVAAVIPSLVAWAENLGSGPTAEGIHQAWMASSQHNVHILDPNLELVGICADRDSKNQLWVTQRFATSRPPQTTVPTAPTTPTTARATTTAPPTTATTTPPTTVAPVTEPPTTASPTTTSTTAAPTTTSPPPTPAQIALNVHPASASTDRVSPGLIAAVILGAFALAAVGLLAIARSRRP
jgi:hypothetical protein